jgi:O-antigen/teichoic acid export membrane protein
LNKGTATFADNVAALTAGSAIAFGFSILASPITSRLFGPQEFGLAALFMSGATILSVIACLRYEMAIVLPKEDMEYSIDTIIVQVHKTKTKNIIYVQNTF